MKRGEAFLPLCCILIKENPMLNIFKRNNKKNNNIYAFATGDLKPIEEVNDDVFSQKMMGDGIAITPSSDFIVSPAAGEIVMIYSTLHAFGIRLDNGIEILVHLGLDTVAMNGEGFMKLSSVGKKVKAGTPIIKMDRNFFLDRGYDIDCMLIVVKNDKNIPISFTKTGYVNAGQDVIGEIGEQDE